ncbi:hypothetical protein ACLOJK_000552 [Asimina triloba]
MGVLLRCFFFKSIEELKHALLCTTLELETTRLTAQQEIRRRDEEVKQLNDLLMSAIRERDEANDKYQILLLQLQQQQQQPPPPPPDDGQGLPRGDSNAGLSSSECEESIVSGSSPGQNFGLLDVEATATTAGALQLPEKGKLLQAVMKAGPLLQTLLLAGPLPQWRHPPPLDTLEIPPVTIPAPPALNSCSPNKDSSALHPLPITTTTTTDFCSADIINTNPSITHTYTNINNKRPLLHCHGSDSSLPTAKYQRIILQ